MSAPRALVVHPPEDRDQLTEALAADGWTVRTVETATAALATLGTESFDCLVSAYQLPGDDGVALRAAVRQLEPSLPFVLVTPVETSEIPISFETPHDSYVHKNGEATAEELQAVLPSAESRPMPSKADIDGHEPSASDLKRAIEAAPVGISLSDPSLSDNPLVYVNETWGEFTGYDTDEVLGRNPRMLQGPQTDEDTVATLAEAIDNDEPTTVEIRNYQKDGTPFWNELTIAPVENDDGEIAHYVGFQINVTDRREAEELADEHSAKLSRERQTLRRVLDRINGLLSEISHVLVESTERTVLEDQVCGTITTEPGYAASWIGHVDSDDTFRLTATSGLDAEDAIPTAELSPAINAAIDTDERRLTTSDDGRLSPTEADSQRLLVVPLCYGDRRYGLLGVYGTEGDALDQREQELFDSLGTMIANGLHAVETTRILTTDQVTELQIGIHDESFHLSQIADCVGTSVDHVGTTRAGDGTVECYLSMDSTANPVESVESLSFVRAGRTVSETTSSRTIAVTLETTTPYDLLADRGAVITGVTATPSAAELTVEAPPDQTVRAILDQLRAAYETVDLQARTQCDRRQRQLNEFAAAVDEQLTERQRAALEAAALNDYFAWPRPVDGEEIAETMDITRQTFHQHLRAAERKLVDAYLDAD